MSENIENSYGHYSCKVDYEVRPYHRKQFLRLSEIFEMDIQNTHYHRDKQRKSHIDNESCFHCCTYVGTAPLGKQRTDKRCETIGESHTRKDSSVEKIVDKRGRRKRFGRIAAYHDRIGETGDDHTELSHEYGKPEAQNIKKR